MKELHLDMAKHEVAQRILRLQGYPYSLKDYPMFVDIFNSPWSRKLMRSGRQVSKTVTIAANIIVDACTLPYHPIIYANSSSAQTTSFSTSKLDPFLIYSPVVYHNLMKSKHVINNVFNKRLSNMSEIKLTYFSESADRVRGSSSNDMYLDEVQDMLYDAMIDAEECSSAARNPRFMYAGTSKTKGTSLEYFWGLSTAKEWVIPCSGCNKWNRPYMDIIGKHGLVCKHCGKDLNTREGQWYSFSESDTPMVDGYWIPQIILPMHCQNSDKWAKLLEKLENYPESKFLNEVMGLPIGEGASAITEEMIQKMCLDSLPMMDSRNDQNSRGATYMCAGIDWGGGGGNGTSRTVLSIYAVHPGTPKFVKVYGKIYGAGEPTQHVADICTHLRKFGVIMVCGDHGGGNFALSQLRTSVPDIRVVPIMYSDASAPIRWDEAGGRYTVNRTAMIDAFFSDVRQGVVQAFRWAEFKPFADDILAVYEDTIGEKHGKPRRVWRRPPTKPDDALHSMVFGWVGCRVLSNMLNFKHFG